MCRHLVSLGDRHLPHIVADPGDLQFLTRGKGDGRPHPYRDTVQNRGILPVAHHDLSLHAEATADETEFPTTVGGLIQVHEIHINCLPRNVAVELGMELEKGFGELRQPGDPHLGGAECVHPRDDAGTAVVSGRFTEGSRYFIPRFYRWVSRLFLREATRTR